MFISFLLSLFWPRQESLTRHKVLRVESILQQTSFTKVQLELLSVCHLLLCNLRIFRALPGVQTLRSNFGNDQDIGR